MAEQYIKNVRLKRFPYFHLLLGFESFRRVSGDLYGFSPANPYILGNIKTFRNEIDLLLHFET